MKTTMKTALMCACLAFGASAMAQDGMKGGDAMAKDGMKKEMTMQDCKDHMAMVKKDGMKKDDASMKMDKTCNDMMKKDAMKKDSMKGDAMKGDAMKKDEMKN